MTSTSQHVEPDDADDGRRLPGMVVAGYRLDRYLGRGASAYGLEAMRLRDGARVVCKLLRRAHRGDARREASLLREGELLQELAHPNVMPCLEGVRSGGHTLLVYPWLGGAPLREVARAAPLPPAEVVAAILGALTGLERLHAGDVIHRDVKPSNLHRGGDGVCRVMDLGLATVAFGSHGAGVGTEGYRAPEAAHGRYDARADVFGVGMTAHWLLTHALPGRDARGRPLVDPRLTPMLSRWVKQCVALDPDARHEDAARAAETLRAVAEEDEIDLGGA